MLDEPLDELLDELGNPEQAVIKMAMAGAQLARISLDAVVIFMDFWEHPSGLRGFGCQMLGERWLAKPRVFAVVWGGSFLRPTGNVSGEGSTDFLVTFCDYAAAACLAGKAYQASSFAASLAK